MKSKPTKIPTPRKPFVLTTEQAQKSIPLIVSFCENDLRMTNLDRMVTSHLTAAWEEIAPLGNLRSTYNVGNYNFSLGDNITPVANDSHKMEIEQMYTDIENIKKKAIADGAAQLSTKSNFSVKFKNDVTNRTKLSDEEKSHLLSLHNPNKVNLSFTEEEFKEKYPSAYQVMHSRNKVRLAKKSQKALWGYALSELLDFCPSMDQTIQFILPNGNGEQVTVSCLNTPNFEFINAHSNASTWKVQISDKSKAIQAYLQKLMSDGNATPKHSLFFSSYTVK